MQTHPTMMSNQKNLLCTVLLTLCAVLVLSSRNATAQDESTSDTMLTAAGWAEFSTNLKEAIHSDNEGAKVGALSQIIHYGKYLHFDELTVFEVMRMYRDNNDPKVRRMAVVALGNMHNRWAIEFLDMLSRYEQDPTIKKTMEEVVRKNKMKREAMRQEGMKEEMHEEGMKEEMHEEGMQEEMDEGMHKEMKEEGMEKEEKKEMKEEGMEKEEMKEEEMQKEEMQKEM